MLDIPQRQNRSQLQLYPSSSFEDLNFIIKIKIKK